MTAWERLLCRRLRWAAVEVGLLCPIGRDAGTGGTTTASSGAYPAVTARPSTASCSGRRRVPCRLGRIHLGGMMEGATGAAAVGAARGLERGVGNEGQQPWGNAAVAGRTGRRRQHGHPQSAAPSHADPRSADHNMCSCGTATQINKDGGVRWDVLTSSPSRSNAERALRIDPQSLSSEEDIFPHRKSLGLHGRRGGERSGEVSGRTRRRKGWVLTRGDPAAARASNQGRICCRTSSPSMRWASPGSTTQGWCCWRPNRHQRGGSGGGGGGQAGTQWAGKWMPWSGRRSTEERLQANTSGRIRQTSTREWWR